MTDSKILKNLCAELSFRLHSKCINLTKQNSQHKIELQSIVCGSSYSLSPRQSEVKLLGLIHIFVVSGAHFATLQLLLSFFLSPIRLMTQKFINQRYEKIAFCILEFLMLAIFLFATGLCAPAVRSFFQIFAKRIFTWINIQNLVLASGIFSVLIVSPHQYFSLQLSWLCALLLSISLLNGVPSFVLKSIILFLGCSILLAPIATGTLMCILTNIFLAPIISFILFPIGIVATIAPQFNFWFDSSLDLFFQLTTLITPDFFITFGSGKIDLQLGWKLLGFAHFGLHLANVYNIRRTALIS